MKEFVIERSLWVPRARAEVFPFFARAENLGRITPPELGFRIKSRLPIRMSVGAIIDYTISLFHVPMRWRTEITRWDPPHAFEDTQVRGPYVKWVHSHRFRQNLYGTTIEDRVVYAVPFGWLGRIVQPLIARQLDRIFNYRERVLREMFPASPEAG